ncbi:hypothetical protein [Mucilaginibacter panaciglaebae]|uniref:Uncharacterized protein n=1 Tax=Mucilaginibacter panaciglaebae TaxID=502331 RepID=A0ABP7X6I1_9SPHI
MARDIENKEWLNDYEQLKQVSKTNPFKVPDDYFNELPGHIKSAITLDEMKGNTLPKAFTVPENYFEKLAVNIQTRITVEDVLDTQNTGLIVPEHYFDELSSNIQSRILIAQALTNADDNLTVPEGYFADLTNKIKSRIAVEGLLATDTGLIVPENYFENLSSSIQRRIAVEEAMTGMEDTLTVPEGYFNRLNKDILNKTVNKNIVKRKSPIIRMLSSNAFKYATAACFIAIIGTGVFMQLESPEAIHDRSFLHKELSTIPVNDIQNYLEQNLDGTDTQHTLATENLPVNTDDLKAALQDYTDQ